MPSTFAERGPEEMRRASGKPLTGAAAESAQRARIRREEEARLAEANRPMALLMLKLAGGPDGARAKLGRADALKLCSFAGLDADRIAGEWSRTEPVRRQVSEARPDQDYSKDPRHDPEVVRLILSGAPHAEVNAAIKAATDRLLANPPKVVGPPGSYPDEPSDAGAERGVSYGLARAPDGRPVRVPIQRSTGGNVVGTWDAQNHVLRPVNAPDPWEKLHANDRLARNYGLGGQPQPSVTECDHSGSHGPYCPACGLPVPAEVP